MALTEGQQKEAQELFAKGYTTAQVFRHFGAQSIGQESEIAIEERAVAKAETTPAFKPLFQKITDGAKVATNALGLGSATQTFGDLIARTRMGARLTGTNLEANRANIPAPSGKEVAGAVLQTAATAVAPAIAPISLPAQIAAGAGLGYMYDVGGDLIEGASMQDTLTPGLATGVGAAAPAVIRGGFNLFKRGAQEAPLGLPGATQAPTQAASDLALPPGPTAQAAPTMPADDGLSAITQTVSDFGDSVQRVGTRISERTQEQAMKAERLRTATPQVAQAIKAEIDEPVIEYVTRADEPTKKALKEMVTRAEAPKKMAGNARPTQVAEDYAVQQYNLVEKAKKDVGRQIGEISDQFDTLKNIDVRPTQNALLKVLRSNGLNLDIDGNLRLVASDNLKITDEQLAVVNKLFDKISRRNVVSAKNLHELDQWFSTTQRNSRVIDKISDVFVTVDTANGPKEVNIFKVFRDAFGQRLDEVAPENLRALNRQYRQYSNFLEDVEGKIVSNPEFSDLVTANNQQFAEAGLRRIFGEGKGASEREAIYNALDSVSRGLGYNGPRADELYAFGEMLKEIYPDTIQKTSFRGQIGAGIMDKLGAVMNMGQVQPQDKQKALKALLEMSSGE